MIGAWEAAVFHCEDPEVLAVFYEEVLDMVRVQSDPGWITTGDGPDRPSIAVQRVDGYVPPEWPGHLRLQQARLDIKVRDLDLAEAQVLKLGAMSTNAGNENFRVCLDPQRHPFCLVKW
ncbi:glyoxalase [Kocuria polaris]|nr:glyoxalase [Kocuria polaris]